MTHVGEKFALVFVRAPQLLRLDGENTARFGERIPLIFEQLRLFLEPAIDLLELRLLRFELCLRLPECAPLLFELLIADAQLFLARLQLLGLPLRFLQKFLQPLPIFRCAHRDRDRFGYPHQKLGLGRIHGTEKAEFRHRVHDPVDAGRSDQQYGRRSLPDTRCNRQVAGRNIVHADGAIFLGRLS